LLWSTSLRLHGHGIIACDFFVAMTATFRLLYLFIVIEHRSRCLIHCNVTAHPTLLLDPIPAPQCGFVGAREASVHVVRVDHLAHESCLPDLARTGYRLNEAPRLAKTAGER
jgi:hypothetical protein